MPEARSNSAPRTILVVDDEPFVLSCLTGILQLAGFTVLSAGSPEEALRIGISLETGIDLMICDVVMPRLPGPALADEFEVIHPETRWLFIAGLPDHPAVHEHIINRGRAFLAKPFFPRELLAKVNDVLSGTQRRSMAAGA